MFVYLVTNIANGKKYVGQTKQNLQKYWEHCLRRARTGSSAKPALYAAIRKYGFEKFEICPLVIVGSKQDSDFYERRLIKSLDLRNREKGYNCTDGGEGISGYQHTKETKLKMSRAAIGNQNGLGHKVPEEVKAKLRGNRHALGYQHTEEAKKRISLALVGNKRAFKDLRCPIPSSE
jgi:group I intron endonuclease